MHDSMSESLTLEKQYCEIQGVKIVKGKNLPRKVCRPCTIRTRVMHEIPPPNAPK